MATNQVKDSKNNNAQYASSFDSEKVDAKTISEISKKADAGDALLFANKVTQKDTSNNGVVNNGGQLRNDAVVGMTNLNIDHVKGQLHNDTGVGIANINIDNMNGQLRNGAEAVLGSIGNRHSHDKDHGVQNEDHQQQNTISYGNVILNTIAAQRTYVEPTEAASTIRDIGVQVANEILATREALNAKQEVRIMLKDSVLKDTEVFVIKDGKSLSVSFVTGASESADILNQRSGDLRTQLMERLDDVDFVDIQVEDNSQSNADNQNQDGRSQNRFGNGDQSQDEER